MRFSNVLSVVSVLVMVTTLSLAEDQRNGLKEISDMSTVRFGSGIDRLDPDLRLGPGDKVAVILSGKLEASHEIIVDREGSINIPLVGKVSVIDMNSNEAYAAIKNRIDKRYSNVELDFSIVNARDIRIEVMGNVQKPGSYMVSQFCRIAEAIAKSGGPSDSGSLIDIKLIRDKQEIIAFNVYDLIYKGDNSKNLRMKNNDIIFVSPIKGTIEVKGDVRRPGVYESSENPKISEIINLAGGMLPTKIKRKLYVLRINSKTQLTDIFKEIFFEPKEGIDSKDDLILENNDVVIVTNAFDRVPYGHSLFKTVKIMGEVKIPGTYLTGEDETLGSLIKRAGGFKNSAFIQGAVFTRIAVRNTQKSILNDLINAQKMAILEEEARLAASMMTQQEKEIRQRSIEHKRVILNLMAAREPSGRIIVDMEEIANGKNDLRLNSGDVLDIPTVPDWVVITGAVYSSQAVNFIEDKTLEYYINLVGGPSKSADKEDIYVIKANGQCKSKSTGYDKISRGDIIVVPEKV